MTDILGLATNAATGGVPGAVSAVAQFAGKILDRAIPDPAARAAAEAELNRQDHDLDMAELAAETGLLTAQAATNTEQAKSDSIFVSGARPAIMWVLAIGLGIHWIFNPVMVWLTGLAGYSITPPQIDVVSLLTLAPGMLGMKLRTDEKLAGAQSQAVGH